MSRAKNKSLKWWIIGIVGFCCVGGLAAGLIGVGPWDAPEMSRRLPELMEESESLGYPMVSTDLLPIQEVSDEENAAPDLKELASSLGTYPDPWAELPKEDPESSEYQNMEKLVETIEPGFFRL